MTSKTIKGIIFLIMALTIVLPLTSATEVCNYEENPNGCYQDNKGFSVTTEDFVPIVWQCDHRIVYDDNTEPGRNLLFTAPAETNFEIPELDYKEILIERLNNYAFEGEQIQWKVLVMDKNGIDKVSDVYATLDGEIEANCERLTDSLIGSNFVSFVGEESVIDINRIDPACNARILEEKITEFNSDTMAYYLCTLTVETVDSMYGPYDVTVEAVDLDELKGTMDETENWFLNPTIELSVDGDIAFDEVRPGTMSYSDRVLVGNDADDGSGVLLDMFISGTDFYDSSPSGAKCGESNVLELENFAYYATNGAYSTHDDAEIQRDCDEEGYCTINYGIGFNDPNLFYKRNEIIQANPIFPYYTANLLSPGSEMSIIFRLDLPEPCNGDFDTGQIYFWGEAV